MISSYSFGMIAFIFTWLVGLFGVYSFFGIRYFFLKKYVRFGLLVFVAAILTFIAQGMVSFIKGGTDSLSTWFAELPLYVYIIVLSLITLVIPLFVIRFFKYLSTHVSSSSIIKGFDSSNDGFLYFDEDGACLLINKIMEEIATLLTKNYVLNGHTFLKLVKDQTITLSNGMSFKFLDKKVNLNNSDSQIVTELIALDVTELVNKNNILAEDNKKISEMNKELAAYNEETLEVVRHKEILSAKVNIHNEMNSLVLQSSYLLNNYDKKEAEKLLSKWKNNALLLSKETETSANADFINDLTILSDAIGVSIDCDDYSLVEENEKITSLFVAVTKESLLNIAKHTKSKKLTVRISKEKDEIVMIFSNENIPDSKGIIKGGGLTNIEKRVNELNGKMSIINNGQFILRIEVKDAI
ncbi:MAG: hypothetical protein J6T15_04085 [Bacilli bacterium]|nr:hypothetical protein [Bacilli bacterium]